MLGWIATLLGVEVTAEILLKKWAATNELSYMTAGICAYIALAVIFALSMRTGELTTINTAWQCGNVVLVSLYGIFVLKENLTPRQQLGVIIAALAVVLVH